MKLTYLSNQRVIIARLAAVSGNKLALSTVTAAFVHLQAMEDEKALRAGVVPGKLYHAYLDTGITIKEDDQLKDESGIIYTVRKGGVTRWVHGAMDYQEILLDKT